LVAHGEVLAGPAVGRALERALVAVVAELVVGAQRLGPLLGAAAQDRVLMEGRDVDVGARGVHQQDQRGNETGAHALSLCRSAWQDRDHSVSDRRRSMMTFDAYR